jgi:CubicO group peptidase (beta-lactamase class C family)
MVCGLAGAAWAQDFSKVDSWLKANTLKMGGRAVLMVEKDGQLVYSRVVNDKLLAEKFTPQTRQPIASCSKWLSAALVMRVCRS